MGVDSILMLSVIVLVVRHLCAPWSSTIAACACSRLARFCRNTSNVAAKLMCVAATVAGCASTGSFWMAFCSKSRDISRFDDLLKRGGLKQNGTRQQEQKLMEMSMHKMCMRIGADCQGNRHFAAQSIPPAHSTRSLPPNCARAHVLGLQVSSFVWHPPVFPCPRLPSMVGAEQHTGRCCEVG